MLPREGHTGLKRLGFIVKLELYRAYITVGKHTLEFRPGRRIKINNIEAELLFLRLF